MFNNILNNITPVVKNLLILNILFFIAQLTLPEFNENLSLYPIVSEQFKPWQLATHFFMHGGIGHIFFNMFALVIFGIHLEKIWGPKRFLTYYLICAFGAAFLHMIVNYIRIKNLEASFTPEEINYIVENGYDLLKSGYNYNGISGQLNAMYNVPMIGASGAVFGLLAAFGYLFPNTELFLLFIPIPIKAKYFVLAYAGLELFSGISNVPGDNVAHFAHLGGALVGIILVLYWQKNRNQFF